MELRLLRVDLDEGEVGEFSPPEEYVRDCLGGSGLAFRLIADGDLDVDPLGGDNPLYMIAGLLTGTAVPTACKGSMVARSPLSGLWTESTVGGYWPKALAWTGYAGMVITGRAEEPVYLYLDGDELSLRSAGDLWGADTFETVAQLKEKLGDDVEVACIGPAGENGVRYASIMVGGNEARAAGRTGMGAVMGSKNLKAVVVRGANRPAVADAEALSAHNRELIPGIREKAEALGAFGTPGSMQAVEFSGDLPIRNWYQGNWEEGAEAISGQRMVAEALEEHYACFACPIRCGKELRVSRGEFAGTVSHGPEYETCASFGSMVLNDDLEVLIQANDLANRLGLDTISTGSAVAFAMECSEKGLVEEDLPWGSPEALIGLIEDIAHRRGLGEILSLGTRAAAEAIGPLAVEYAVHTKGLEVAYHDPRAFTSMAVSYATGARGGCHLEGLTYYVEGGAFPGSKLGLDDEWDRASSDDKAVLAQRMQDYLGTLNALGLCKFMMRGHVGPREVAAWVEAVTGWTYGPDDLMEAGERVFNLKRLVNNRLGVSRKDDTLSPRLLSHPRPTGGAKGVLPHLGKMLNEYYEVRGWTEEGLPEEKTLARLGLEDLLEVEET